MRRVAAPLVAAMLFAGAPDARAAPMPTTAPLPATGKWLVEGYDNMCALSHDYGAGRGRVTLAIRPWPLGTIDDILLFTQSQQDQVTDGTATIQLDDGPTSYPEHFVEFALKRGERRLLSFRVMSSHLDGLAATKRVTLTLGKHRIVSLAPEKVAAGLAVLHQCQAMLQKQLGFDPAEQARIATPASSIGEPNRWFSADDYPKEAASGGAQGVTRLFLTIGVDGRVARCVAFGSSGNAAMDKVACAKFLQRGRFRAATDATGAALVDHQETSVRWVLPG